ncbi:MAG: hypothetical protein WCL02_05155 [bacterium]
MDYTQEARQIFEKEIKEYRSITERFYLPEDREQIKNIQDFFKKKLNETIPSLNIQQLTKDHTIPIHSIEKVEDKIKLHPSDYVEIERRKIEYTHRFIDGDRNPKEYLFDRLVEYIGKDILTHKIQNLINESKQYKGTTFSIEKTDPLDDTSAGADFMVTYTIPGKQRRKIAAVDLFISNKT